MATLELLTADLIAILWKLDPAMMDKLAHEAEHDLTLQNARTLPAAEHQRERLFSVLQDRKRRLQPPRQTQAASTTGSAKKAEEEAPAVHADIV